VRRLLFTVTLLLASDAASSPAPPHTCRWSFPGGTPAGSSSCSPPAIRYATPGAKRVTLTVCAADGRCTTASKTITILDLRPSITRLNADPPEPYVGDELRLTATTNGKPPFAWLWTLPGSATTRSPQAVLRTARLAPGVLPIKLRLSNVHGSSTRTFYVRLQDPKPVLSGFALSTPTPVLGSLLRAFPTVSGRPPLTYRWTLDGRALGTEPTLVWEVSGSPGPHSLASGSRTPPAPPP
jgi:PKD repeat protein